MAVFFIGCGCNHVPSGKTASAVRAEPTVPEVSKPKERVAEQDPKNCQRFVSPVGGNYRKIFEDYIHPPVISADLWNDRFTWRQVGSCPSKPLCGERNNPSKPFCGERNHVSTQIASEQTPQRELWFEMWLGAKGKRWADLNDIPDAHAPGVARNSGTEQSVSIGSVQIFVKTL